VICAFSNWICFMQASNTFLVWIHAFSHKPCNGFPCIGPGLQPCLFPEKNDII
jgi:hypothetical protein